MKDWLSSSNFDPYAYYQRLLKYRMALKSIIGEREDSDLILLNEEQKAAIKEGEELLGEVKKEIGKLESSFGFGKGFANA